MAYLPEFEHDIFISYAHVDNETVDPREVGWVAHFVRHLEVELWRRAGRKGAVKIWWDSSLDGNQAFDDTIKNRIFGSAIFIALTSHGYLGSQYCLQELRWFRECVEQQSWGLKVGDRPRCINVLLYNLHHDKWPAELQGQSGLPMHGSIRQDDEGDPLATDEKRFAELMREHSRSVFNTLQHFNETIESAQARNAVATAPAMKPDPAANQKNGNHKAVVFLAEVSNTLETRRESVANELRQQGIHVIDNIPPPHQSAAHDEAVKVEIARADLAVHLLNDLRGTKIIDDGSQRYPQRQVELGLEFAKSQLIWVPQSLDQQTVIKIEDTTHRELLNRLENGNREQSRYRFLRESPSAIAREVINRLQELEELKQVEELERQSQAQAEAVAALIDTHQKDQFKALELGRAIEEGRWQPLINPSVDDPALSAQILEDRLKKVSKLIVLFGEVAEAWVDGRLREALQIALNTPNCPLRKLAVCFAPPQRKDAGIRFDLGFVQVHHFNLEELLDPPTLAEFLKS
jgi:hypothetical protein